MNQYQQYVTEQRRLCILILLLESKNSANDRVLTLGLETLGYRHLPRETIREDIRWLIDQGLITDEWFKDVLVCTITRRGVEVAQGKIEVPGVAKKSLTV